MWLTPKFVTGLTVRSLFGVMELSHRVLIPFELPDAEPLSPVLAETIAPLDVVALGHFGVPEQTPVDAARDQFEADASAELEDLVAPIEAAGSPVTTRLVFGKARDETVDRIALEEECDVILTPGVSESVDRILVPLRGEVNISRILSFVAELLAFNDASVTLFHSGEESDRIDGEDLLNQATDRLIDEGVDPEFITRQLGDKDDAGQRIVELAADYDLLVIGETEPSLRERILGAIPIQITGDTDAPTFVVRDTDET